MLINAGKLHLKEYCKTANTEQKYETQLPVV